MFTKLYNFNYILQLHNVQQCRYYWCRYAIAVLAAHLLPLESRWSSRGGQRRVLRLLPVMILSPMA